MANNNASNADFLNTLRVYARRTARRNGYVTIDEVRNYALKKGLEPSSPSVWGSIFRTDDFVQYGDLRSSFPSNKGRLVTLWTLAK